GVCVVCFNAGRHLDLLPKATPVTEPVKKRDVLVLRRTLKNNMRVTKPQWNKINECWCCKGRIPWEEAEKASFMGGRVVCAPCDKELEEDRLPKTRKR
ncbi:UNVERIFIED_CONTAM: hypothetical protein RF648_19265, partial [Kocuria sp. CPCC 205274]